MRWTLNVVLISISYDQGCSKFLLFFLAIWTSLKEPCSVSLPISSLGHWFFGSLVFWAPCIFWLLIPCQMNSWQRFSLILWAACPTWWPLPLLVRSLLVSCSPTCQSFLLVGQSLEFYLGSHCLCLYVPVFSLLFPELVSSFIWRSLIQFKLIFIQGELHGSSFSFLHTDIWFSQ
jgi:hypothetical protein